MWRLKENVQLGWRLRTNMDNSQAFYRDSGMKHIKGNRIGKLK